MFLFSIRHRHGHLTSGRAVAKAVLGSGCVEGVIKGGGGAGGGGAKGWAVVTAAEGRQLERVGGARAKASRSSPRTGAGGGEGSDGQEEGPPSGGGTE